MNDEDQVIMKAEDFGIYKLFRNLHMSYTAAQEGW